MTWLIILIIALAVLLPEILSTVLDSRLGRAMATRLEQGGQANVDEVTSERLRYLENELDRLSEEVHRLTEESAFLHELLAGRNPDDEPRLPPGDTST